MSLSWPAAPAGIARCVGALAATACRHQRLLLSCDNGYGKPGCQATAEVLVVDMSKHVQKRAAL